jgi:hypothetical protein
MHTAFAAGLFGVLVLLVAAFQFALAAGAPWGNLTMGGTFPGRLPPPLRVAAMVQALVLLLFGVIVAARARLALTRWHAVSRKLIWVVVGYTVLGAVLNAITASPWERALWLPVTLVLGICAAAVTRDE